MLSTVSSLSPRAPAKSMNAFIQKWDPALVSNPQGRAQRDGGLRDGADALLPEVVGMLNRAGARITRDDTGIIIGLPRHSINATTRQAVENARLFGESCDPRNSSTYPCGYRKPRPD